VKVSQRRTSEIEKEIPREKVLVLKKKKKSKIRGGLPRKILVSERTEA
jgi:hypothetical protein